ncbi:MAG: hypothetical protein QXY52_06075 [Conexivisphaerales archaeon]
MKSSRGNRWKGQVSRFVHLGTIIPSNGILLVTKMPFNELLAEILALKGT